VVSPLLFSVLKQQFDSSRESQATHHEIEGLARNSAHHEFFGAGAIKQAALRAGGLRPADCIRPTKPLDG
jgi:hypothetical protein